MQNCRFMPFFVFGIVSNVSKYRSHVEQELNKSLFL